MGTALAAETTNQRIDGGWMTVHDEIAPTINKYVGRTLLEPRVGFWNARQEPRDKQGQVCFHLLAYDVTVDVQLRSDEAKRPHPIGDHHNSCNNPSWQVIVDLGYLDAVSVATRRCDLADQADELALRFRGGATAVVARPKQPTGGLAMVVVNDPGVVRVHLRLPDALDALTFAFSFALCATGVTGAAIQISTTVD